MIAATSPDSAYEIYNTYYCMPFNATWDFGRCYLQSRYVYVVYDLLPSCIHCLSTTTFIVYSGGET